MWIESAKAHELLRRIGKIVLLELSLRFYVSTSINDLLWKISSTAHGTIHRGRLLSSYRKREELFSPLFATENFFEKRRITKQQRGEVNVKRSPHKTTMEKHRLLLSGVLFHRHGNVRSFFFFSFFFCFHRLLAVSLSLITNGAIVSYSLANRADLKGEEEEREEKSSVSRA